MLQERFLAFSHDTIQTGTERVADANKLSDDLINIGHSDADKIAEWKDLINDAWDDLVELISTREEVRAFMHPNPHCLCFCTGCAYFYYIFKFTEQKLLFKFTIT